VSVDSVNIDNITTELIDGFWSQIFHHYRAGEKYWFDGDEINIINENNKQYEIVSVEEELLLKYFEPGTEVKTTTEIQIALTEKSDKTVKISTRRLGQILRKHFERRKNQNGQYGYALREKKVTW